MIKNKNIFFQKKNTILFLIISILATGCGTSGLGQSSSKPVDINIFAGTQGLTADFSKTSPPQKVFENSAFPILLRIRNNGAFNINDKNILSKNGALLSIGRERDYIPSMSFENKERLKLDPSSDNLAAFYIAGKTQINPNGDEIIISATAKTGKLDPQSENKQSTITATMCYPYKTILSATICIDPDVGKVRPGKKVCEVKDLSFSNGQGAPIAITKIESQMIPIDKKDSKGNALITPQFLIYVENRGKGISVDSSDYRSACLKTDKYSGTSLYWNGAFVRAFTSGEVSTDKESNDLTQNENIKINENELLCCPNFRGECPEELKEYSTVNDFGYLRFIDNKDFIRCTFRNGISKNSDAFTSPLRVEIDYGYVQTISANFQIQKPVRY